jgi:D-alanyl-D-alanine carboxypeptidase
MSELYPASGRVRRSRFARIATAAGIWLAAASLACAGADAAVHRHHFHTSRISHVRGVHAERSWHWQPTHRIFQLTDPEKDAALILDGETGRALYARNADALRHPASLTKMMTLYLLFEQLKNGQMTLATPIPVSWHAASQAPTKLYLRPGSAIPVDDAIKAVVVLSANDVAVAIAEALGGTEGQFAELMTAKARSWGMSHTFFHNASGLPDPQQITSAGDLAILARHLAYDFPQYFHYFSTYSFSYRGATHFTHDNLIGRYEGADGIKTGYTGASGFNLVSSVVRNGVHIIGVVMGGTTARRRDSEMVRLLDDTFAAVDRNPLLVARAAVPWRAIAQNAQSKPVIAGFPFAADSSGLAHLSVPSTEPPLQTAIAKGGSEDEEAAESSPDPAYEPAAVVAKPVAPPPPSKTVTLSPPIVVSKAVVASLESAPAHLSSVAAAGSADAPAAPSGQATPRPRAKPSMSSYASAAPSDDNGSLPLAGASSNWTVQIGAFGNANLAQSQLAAYARKSTDVLGQAARIISPFESAEGHVIYRARFGPFDESHARQVCQVLSQRGQNCFAAVASR